MWHNSVVLSIGFWGSGGVVEISSSVIVPLVSGCDEGMDVNGICVVVILEGKTQIIKSFWNSEPTKVSNLFLCNNNPKSLQMVNKWS